jgi:hypothetical protein
MPQQQQLLRAELREIEWNDQQEARETGRMVPVQFNPETLKVSFSNKNSNGDQRGGSAIQFVGRGATKLSFEIWFDVSAPGSDAPGETDVRKLTEKVVKFIQPRPTGERDKFVPPGVRFLWGTFLFDGIVDSIDESLEFFSPEGRPLRASLSVNISKQEIQFQFGNQTSPGLGGSQGPGTEPLTQARQGDSLQSALGRTGKQDQWQSVADANGIDNPRMLAAGATFNARAGLAARGGFGASAGARQRLAASFGVGAGIGAGGVISAGGGASASPTANVTGRGTASF